MEDSLKGKKIIVGITGCIAAYKACWLIRELIKRKATVKIVTTPSALNFVTPLTLSTLSKNKIISDIFLDSRNSDTPIWHVDYSRWADLTIIAPATINTVAKIAYGFADNALTTLVPALKCPVIIAPAADVDMYENSITQENLRKLSDLSYFIVDAEIGELASGLHGKGRLADIHKIIDGAELILSGYKKDLQNKKILVTAGPTFEDIDPVRFIGNRSSGKMGFELAKAAFLRGAEVTLISGPTAERAYEEINLVEIRNASEMKRTVDAELKKNDILIMAAAVADFKPKTPSKSKIKKEQKISGIQITNTDDILGNANKNGKTIVGFALETDKEIQNATKKLKEKNLDLIVLNSLKDKKSGFEYNTNKITILTKDRRKKEFPLQTKFQAANKILSEILKIS
jgi:phosphopantothenoylcysteine decarboxylase/phosphopantothenate--cysteine ligase